MVLNKYALLVNQVLYYWNEPFSVQLNKILRQQRNQQTPYQLKKPFINLLFLIVSIV